MEDSKENIVKKYISKSVIGGTVSINDLREMEYKDETLSPSQRLAIKNYDRYRITELNKQTSEENFHRRYFQLQVLANLAPYEEFLKENYFS